MRLRHICEVCGVEEILTPDAAFEAGWDYPPKIGTYRVIGPRLCPNCPIAQTLWWAITVHGSTIDQLTPDQQVTAVRILGEPDTIRTYHDRGGPYLAKHLANPVLAAEVAEIREQMRLNDQTHQTQHLTNNDQENATDNAKNQEGR